MREYAAYQGNRDQVNMSYIRGKLTVQDREWNMHNKAEYTILGKDDDVWVQSLYEA